MFLYAYHQKVTSILLDRSSLLWVEDWMYRAGQIDPNDTWFPRKAKNLRAHKLCSIGYAMHYGLEDQWQDMHTPVDTWAPKIDFVHAGKKIRIVPTVVNEQSGEFGSKLVGRVHGYEFKRGFDRYVLAAWYTPYVDLIGWLPPQELRVYQRMSNYGKDSYDLQEIVTRPMATLLE